MKYFSVARSRWATLDSTELALDMDLEIASEGRTDNPTHLITGFPLFTTRYRRNVTEVLVLNLPM
jgi:hypothetical protein